MNKDEYGFNQLYHSDFSLYSVPLFMSLKLMYSCSNRGNEMQKYVLFDMF